MRIFDAWGIEAYVVDQLNKEACSTLEIQETENELVWETPFSIFKVKAFKRDFSSPQYFLERKFWTVRNAKGQVLQERTILREELEARQGKLPL